MAGLDRDPRGGREGMHRIRLRETLAGGETAYSTADGVVAPSCGKLQHLESA